MDGSLFIVRALLVLSASILCSSSSSSSSSSASFDAENDPHRRYNPLLDEWVLVSPHRAKRPWSGQMEPGGWPFGDRLSETNPLGPSNMRGSSVNPPYEGTYVFDNDFPALKPDTPKGQQGGAHPLLRMEGVRGRSKVMCFSPYGDETLALMEPAAIRAVVDDWAAMTAELGETWRWVQIFENRGAAMGCSNSHPHCQVWAADYLPTQPQRKDDNQRAHFYGGGGGGGGGGSKTRTPLLLEYARLEEQRRERVVLATEHWIVVVPWWAAWP